MRKVCTRAWQTSTVRLPREARLLACSLSAHSSEKILPSDPGGRRARSRSGQQPLPGAILAHWDKVLRFYSAWVKEHLHLGPQLAVLTVTPTWLLPGVDFFKSLYPFNITLKKKKSHETVLRDSQTYRALGFWGV